MILLSNCLEDAPDEGSLKTATRLTQALKEQDPMLTVVSYERRCTLTDRYFSVNKLFFSRELFRFLGERQENVLFLPFPTRAVTTALRIFWLSWMVPVPVTAVLSMTRPHGAFSRLLLKHSRARLVALSRKTADHYADILGENRVTYLKTGVDTAEFCPATEELRRTLKRRYGLDPDRKTVLHVGHMKTGRNLDALLGLDPSWQVVLITSSFTRETEDPDLRQRLAGQANIRILEGFLPEIREWYQLADVYFFPVLRPDHCIDVPLSCLEAAACGVPVVTTAHGEMAEFEGKPGFFLWDGREDPNHLLQTALGCRDVSREAVLCYDWNRSARQLLEELGK